MAKQSAAAIRKAWLKQHAAGERLLSKVLAKFFRGQTKRVYTAATKAGASLSVASVPTLFDAADERELMAEALAEPLLSFMATGAERALKLAKQAKRKGKAKTTKALDDDDADEVLDDFTLSDDLKAAIKSAYEELASQDYWGDIQANVKESISDILKAGIEEGLTGRKLAARLSTALGGEAETRAKAIARTETTLAYAAGQQASYSELASDGVEIQKTWLAIVDADTRPAHSELDGETVGVDEDFSVGGSKAPYPGHWSLPPGQRVNCRCATSAEFGD